MRSIVLAAGAAVLLAGCGSGDSPGGPPPATSSTPTTVATVAPTQAAIYNTGSAHVRTSGSQSVSFEADLDPKRGASYTPGDGFDLWWRNGDQALNVSGDLVSGKVDAFVRVETGKGTANAFVDSWHTVCTVILNEYSDTSIVGSFTCPKLPNFTDTSSIDAEGSFRADAASLASSTPSG